MYGSLNIATTSDQKAKEVAFMGTTTPQNHFIDLLALSVQIQLVIFFFWPALHSV
jgi:hypothetical protein